VGGHFFRRVFSGAYSEMGSIFRRAEKKYSYIRPLIWFRCYSALCFLKSRIIGRRPVDTGNIDKFGRIVFLLPRFMYLDAVFETSDEIVQSFREYSPDAEVDVIFYDVSEIKENAAAISEKIRTENPTHIVYLYGPNPSFSLSSGELKGFMHQFDAVKIVIFTDVIRIAHLYMLYKMRRVFDIVVALDAAIPFRFGKVADIGPVMGCISERSYFDVVKPQMAQERDIDLLILGTMYSERRNILELLRAKNIAAVSSGGTYGSTRLTYSEYFGLSARAKIRVVTSFTEKRDAQINKNSTQLKAHIAEAIASRSLLFVDSLLPTANFLEEGADFIYFSGMDDLLEKTKYYLHNESRREEIANSGHEKWKNSYMGGHFWEYIFERAIKINRDIGNMDR